MFRQQGYAIRKNGHECATVDHKSDTKPNRRLSINHAADAARYQPEVPQVDEEQVVQSLRQVLRIVADSFVGLAAHDVVGQVLLEEFVTAAHRNLLEKCDARVTQSQIGLLTGVKPEQVREVLNRPCNGEQKQLSVEARILTMWETNEDFMDPATGKPGKLLIFGAKGTFQGLINRVVRGVTPQDVMRKLVERGNVEIVDNHWIRLLDPEWVHESPARDDCADCEQPHCPLINYLPVYES